MTTMNNRYLKIVIGNLNNPTDSSLLATYSIESRLPGIVASLKNADIVVFSEVYSSTVDRLVKMLRRKGYKCHSHPYSTLNIENSQYHIIGVRYPAKILEAVPLWFTSTPYTESVSDPLLVKCEERFSKSALSVMVKHKDDIFAVIGTHFSLPRYYRSDPFEYQRESANILVGHIQKLKSSYPEATIILGSDFNTFSDAATNIFESAGLIDITPPGDTFVSFPTDLGILNSQNRAQARVCRKKFEEAEDDFEILCAAYEYFYKTSGDLLRARLDRIYWMAKPGMSAQVNMTDMSRITLPNIMYGYPQSLSDHAIFNIIIE